MIAILAGILCAAGAVLAHAALCRWLSAAQYISAAMWCLIAALLCGAVLLVLSGRSIAAGDWLLFLVLVPSLMSTYVLIFFGIGWDSPTLALANSILDHGAAGMDARQLEFFIEQHPFVDSRLDAMIRAGVITEKGTMLHARADIGIAVRLAEAYRKACGMPGMAG
jgi:hypothetical protein